MLSKTGRPVLDTGDITIEVKVDGILEGNSKKA